MEFKYKMDQIKNLILRCFGGDKADFGQYATDREAALLYLQKCMDRNMDWQQTREELEEYLDSICLTEASLSWKEKQLALAQRMFLPWLDVDDMGDDIRHI